MKKLKGLLVTLAVLFLIPMTVFAEGNEKINVYIFKGEGCGYCAKALAFFEGLDDEYQNYFNLVEKEVWHDEDNAAKMQEVADYFNEDVSGVPYIIVGETTFQGFATEYEEQIKTAIKKGYENADGSYKDVVASILGGEVVTKDKNDNSTAITIIVIVAVIAGIGFLIYMARDDSVEVEEEKKSSNQSKKKSKK